MIGEASEATPVICASNRSVQAGSLFEELCVPLCRADNATRDTRAHSASSLATHPSALRPSPEGKAHNMNISNAIRPGLYGMPTSKPEGAAEHWAPDNAGEGPWTLQESYAYCEQVARRSSTNFAIATRCVPPELHRDVWAIYAFARVADDFADEAEFEGRRLEALDRWEELLDLSFREDIDHPVFLALRDTVRRHDIPLFEFKSLLMAYRWDLRGQQPRTFGQLRDYCAHAASPIGRLALYIHGERSSKLHRFSDDLCIGVQLAHHLRNLAVDVTAGRIYIPLEDTMHFGVDFSGPDLSQTLASEEFKELVYFCAARARTLLTRGRPLIRRVDSTLAGELAATWNEALQILDALEASDFEPACDTAPHAGFQIARRG